ncbi:MFS transporter [Maricaulis sp.]|uniref:AmpG family muropeptide MFS transporter n=1 Tax=Maricaulis sp. TaxID=1486257 RepID=UPI0025C2D5E0|nr:MFS transporter [Maricaulis sp.]
MAELMAPARKTWGQTLAAYGRPIMIAMLILGFASGLPLMMVFSKLSFWLRDAGIERSTIGFFYWVTISYTLKPLWAPVVDRMPIPFLTSALGKRRSWMIVAILGTMVGLAMIAFTDPANGLVVTALGAFILSYSGATLDISIDAWRIESGPRDDQANMAAAYVLGYRGAIMFSGFGLAISEWTNWTVSFLVMAATMGACAILVLFMKEPYHAYREPDGKSFGRRVADSVIEPFKQFWDRLGNWIVPVFLLVAFYRLSDFTMGVMASPLYSDMGFDRAIVGGIQSGPGIIATISGGFLGGLIAYRFGVLRTMVVGAVITFATNAAFAYLAATGDSDSVGLLAAVISADNIAAGFVGTAFIAYLSSLTDPLNAATQYALLSSLYALICKFIAGFSGVMAETMGYVGFFVVTASYALPMAALIIFIMLRGTDAARGVRDLEKTADAAP